MSSDSSQSTSTAQDTEESTEQAEELLVEEISIDGMCGVY